MPAVSVARKGQGDARRHARKNVRLVCKQDNWVVGCDLRKRPRQVVDAAKSAAADAVGNLITDASDPNPLALGAKQDCLILQHRNARYAYGHVIERECHLIPSKYGRRSPPRSADKQTTAPWRRKWLAA